MTKKIVSIILIIALISSLCVCFASCNKEKADKKEPVYTSEYLGKTSYLVGEEFENGELVIYKDGKEDARKTLTSQDITGFSTTKTTGNSKFKANVNGKDYFVNYFVSLQATWNPTDYAYKDGNVLVYKDLIYGDRLDVDHKGMSQLCDLYLPEDFNEDTPVFLYVHGGAWVIGSKDDEGADINLAYAKENGFAAFTMNYILAMDLDMSKVSTPADILGMLEGLFVDGGSMDNMLSDIGTMIGYMKSLLPLIGIKTDKIALGGLSAGGQLSTLFAYKYGDIAPLKVAMEVDIVGPTQFSDLGYKYAVQGLLANDPVNENCSIVAQMAAQAAAKELLNTLFGLPIDDDTFNYFPDEDVRDLDAFFEPIWLAVDEYSSVLYITEKSCPTILVYGKRPAELEGMAQMFDMGIFAEGVDNDLLVPTNCYYTMRETLTKNNVPFVGKLFEGETHLDAGHVRTENKDGSLDYLLEQTKAFAKLYL